MTKLVFGCGYLGSRVARRWVAEGERVAAVTRSHDRVDALRRDGIEAVVADVCRRESLRELPEAETVLVAIGYDRGGGSPRREVIVAGLRNVLSAVPNVQRLIYVSSTGVMGDHDGAWVDETALCQPQREAGQVALEAERLLADHALAGRTVVLRLAGLYGPGRLPKLADIKSGRPVAAPEGAYLNLIHVDDAAAVVLAAERCPRPGALYLVSDGSPTRHREFYRELARQLGMGEVEFVAPEPGSRGAAAALGNKRIDNRRMLDELGVKLRFGDYRPGLRAILGPTHQ